MKKFIALIAIVAIAYIAFGRHETPALAQQPAKKPAFVVVIDDSGVLTEAQRAEQQKLMLFAQLKKLYKHRAYARADLHVISTSYGRDIWAGTISDLRSNRAEELLEKIKSHPDNCNKLEASFTGVRTSIRQLEQQGANDIHVIFFSSLISTPAPCADTKSISLPQLPVPVQFDKMLAASEAVSSIEFLWVNPHQFRLYQDALAPVAHWAKANGKGFGIFDVEQTEAQLRSGLLLGGGK